MSLGRRGLVWALLASALVWSSVVGVARATITVPLAGTVAAPAVTNAVGTVAPATASAARTLGETPTASVAAAVVTGVAKTSVSPAGLPGAAPVVRAIAKHTIAAAAATAMPATRTISHTQAPITTAVPDKLVTVAKALGQTATPVTRVISTLTSRAGTPGRGSSAPSTATRADALRARSLPTSAAVIPSGANTLSATAPTEPTWPFIAPAMPTLSITAGVPAPLPARSGWDLVARLSSQVAISGPRFELSPLARVNENPVDSAARAFRTPSASGNARGPAPGIPVGVGAGGGATSSASAFFFFSFAAMLAAMLALPAPRFVGRLWLPRELGPPAPFVLLLDHPG